MNSVDKQYLDLGKLILENNQIQPDRTGTGILTLFSPPKMTFDLKEGFPLLTTKRVFFKGLVHELLWFLSGSTNVNDLDSSIQKWWTPWAKDNGELGPIYGSQYRHLVGKHGSRVDQLNNTLNLLKKDPNSRRHVMTMWNPAVLDEQRLACCHGTVIQFHVYDNKLSCFTHQRSSDYLLGLPVNIGSYALLTHMFAHELGYEVDKLHYSLGNAHIYTNHIDQVNIQLTRDARELPSLTLNPEVKRVVDFKFEDVTIMNYNPHPALKAPLAI